MMWGYGGGAAMWWMVVESVIWVVVAAAIVAGVIALAPGGLHSDWGSAKRILDERFARGEIDEEEYKRRMAMLH